MTHLKALIFDVDGTLADTERDGHRVAFNQAFAEAGLDWSWSVELYGELLAVTGGKERIRHYLDRHRPDFQRPDLDAFITGLHAAKTRHYLALLAKGGIPLRPGVRRLLREARSAGMDLAIATTTTPENVTVLLQNTLGEEALSWFKVIAAGDIVPAKKPAPDIYVFTVQELGLEPEECVALEDSGNGICAARDAGLPTVITVNDYTRGDDFSGALAVLSDMGDLGAPMKVLQGCIPGSAYLDITTLRRLHDAAYRRRA